ncbi:MAG: HAMP domain-containing sensor histidine kinase, partial [Chloroflexota bacterium]
GSGETLLRMIDRVLDFARLETGRIDLAMETVLAGDAVRRALELVRPLATGFQTVIDERGTQDRIEVRANGQRLVTVIWDLLDNAVRHGGAGVVHVSVVVESTGGGLARIRVTDDGVGMDEDQVQHAFTPFLSGSDGGAALGLSLGRRLVEAMGGTLEIESRLGAGTISTITLPEWRADGPGSGDRAATAHAKAAG